jgi:WD40 repeat protein
MVWDLDGGPPAPPFTADSPVNEVAPSADGTELIGATDTGLVVWNVTSREVTHRVPQEKFVGHLAVSSNGRFLACSVGDTGLVVLDAKTYRQRTLTRGSDVARLAFDPAGSLLATASYQERTVPIWDVEANVMVARLPAPTYDSHHVAFSADRRTLVVAGPNWAQTWDLQAADEKRTWRAHTDGVCGLAFSPDGRRLVSTSHDRTAIIWDVATGQPRRKLTGFRGAVQIAAFSPDGRLLATADQEGPVRLWLAETGEELPAIRDGPGPCSYHVEFSPGGEYLAATGDGLAVWRCVPDPGRPGGLSLKRVASEAGTRSLHAAFSPDGRWLAWVDQNTRVRLWDVAQRRASPCGAPVMRSGWYGLVFRPGSHVLSFLALTAQRTGWDVEEDRPAAVSDLVADIRKGRYVVRSLRPLEQSLWDTETGREVFALPQMRSTAWCEAWSPTDRLLAAGLTSGEVVIWDIDRVWARLAELGLAPE